jgi:hypothetical protein
MSADSLSPKGLNLHNQLDYFAQNIHAVTLACGIHKSLMEQFGKPADAASSGISIK